MFVAIHRVSWCAVDRWLKLVCNNEHQLRLRSVNGDCHEAWRCRSSWSCTTSSEEKTKLDEFGSALTEQTNVQKGKPVSLVEDAVAPRDSTTCWAATHFHPSRSSCGIYTILGANELYSPNHLQGLFFQRFVVSLKLRKIPHHGPLPDTPWKGPYQSPQFHVQPVCQ